MVMITTHRRTCECCANDHRSLLLHFLQMCRGARVFRQMLIHYCDHHLTTQTDDSLLPQQFHWNNKFYNQSYDLTWEYECLTYVY